MKRIAKIKLKIIFSLSIIIFLLSCIGISNVIITDTSVQFNADPLRIVRYNSTSQNLEIFNNLTVENLTVNENLTANFYYAEAWYINHDGTTLNFVSDIWYNLTFNISSNL